MNIDAQETILTTIAVTVSALFVAAVIGISTFGIIAGHNAYKNQRFHKAACRELVSQQQWDNYVRACRYVDIIELTIEEGTDLDNTIIQLDEEGTPIRVIKSLN